MIVKVAAYCRVSSLKDEQSGSLKNQREFFEEFIHNKADYLIHEIYHDKKSATKWQTRDGFKQMLLDAGLDITMTEKGNPILETSNREPLFSRILIKDVSRFARDQVALDIIRKLRDKKVFVDFITMGLSSENTNDDTMMGMCMVFAEHESRDRSVKVIFGKNQGAKNGVINTADKFYGYRYIKESNELIIVPEEAEVIRKMFELYNSGEGIRRILNYLRENKMLTRAGKDFGPTTVNRMLQNQAYKGWLIRNKFDTPKVFSSRKSNRLRPEEEWKVHEGRIPAIVTEEEFDRAQQLRVSKINHQLRRGVNAQVGELAGKIVCSKCNAPYVRNRESKNNRVFYNCRTKKRQGVKHCNAPNIFEEVLDWAIEHFTENSLESSVNDFKNDYKFELTMLKEKLNERLDGQSTELAEELSKKIESSSEEAVRLRKLFIKGSINEEEFDSMYKEIDVNLRELESEHTYATASNKVIIDELQKIDDAIQQIVGYKTGIKDYTRSDVIKMLNAIKILKTEATLQTQPDGTSKEVDEATIIFQFEFKVFENLIEIANKYLEYDQQQIVSRSSVSVLYYPKK